jgi:acyl carrier protein
LTEQGGTPGTPATPAIEQQVVAIVEDLTQDWGLELQGRISGATRLFKDLDFASVDIIQLCVAIEQNYNRKLGFQDLLMKEGAYVSDLTIGQVAEFVAKRTSKEMQ